MSPGPLAYAVAALILLACDVAAFAVGYWFGWSTVRSWRRLSAAGRRST